MRVMTDVGIAHSDPQAAALESVSDGDLPAAA